MSSLCAPNVRLAGLVGHVRQLWRKAGWRRVQMWIGAAANRLLPERLFMHVARAAQSQASWRPRDPSERLRRRPRRTATASAAAKHSAMSSKRTIISRYGPGFFSSIGARGGSVVLEERGTTYLQSIGARGGAATMQRYGARYYAQIGRKGGLAGKGKRRPRSQPGQLRLPLED